MDNGEIEFMNKTTAKDVVTTKSTQSERSLPIPLSPPGSHRVSFEVLKETQSDEMSSESYIAHRNSPTFTESPTIQFMNNHPT